MWAHMMSRWKRGYKSLSTEVLFNFEQVTAAVFKLIIFLLSATCSAAMNHQQNWD
jgi:hypothetical protein